ncbi:GAF domain-containing protein [Microcella sp.]|uniref:GAF domain-containing sensor histidine kinase n=1 Tax=Microcella sp. TaxID=1913979 RepID=UPI00391D660F
MAATAGESDELETLVRRVLDDAADESEGRHRVSLLLSAAQAVTRDLDLTTALQRIVEAARQLVRARYGALGVIARDGSLERFLHSGLDDETVARLGPPPTGRGILGAVIADDATIRLPRLSDDPRSVGFPEHHPPMNSFLGVPIHVAGEAFGNLYLTERDSGPFDDLDASVIASLAAMAGTAIANSRLYARSERSRVWLEAAEEISRRLLAGELSADDGRAIVAAAMALTGGTAEAITVDDDDRLVVDPHSDARGGTRDFADDEATLTRFVESVTIARELARARVDEQRIALSDERDRIARDLHDHVIQSLFAVGLSLQSVVGDPTTPTGARIATQVDAIDSTIRQIRQAIYRLSAPPSATAYSLRARINTLVRETLEGEDLDSGLEFQGPVDTLVNSELGDEVVAVVREALSNAVRHAQARRVDVAVAVQGAEVSIRVVDDGRGLGQSTRRSGLDNLRGRAVERGGTFAVTSPPTGGTELLWRVPWGAS